MPKKSDEERSLVDQLRELVGPGYRKPGEKLKRPRKAITNKASQAKALNPIIRQPEGNEEALKKVRHKTFIHLLPKCTKPGCRAVAVRGTGFCRNHGGQKEIRRRIMSHPKNRPAAAPKIKSTMKAAIELGELPEEMIQTPVFRDVYDWAFNTYLPKRAPKNDPNFAAKNGWRIEQTRRMTVALKFMHALVAAWVHAQDTDDWGPWASVVAAAASAPHYFGAGRSYARLTYQEAKAGKYPSNVL